MTPIPACARCPECGTPLVRADTFWVCPVAFHSRGVPDEVLKERLGREVSVSEDENWVAFRRLLREFWRRLPFTRRPPK